MSRIVSCRFATAAGCGVLRNVHAEANRYGEDDELYYASGPDAMRPRIRYLPSFWRARNKDVRL